MVFLTASVNGVENLSITVINQSKYGVKGRTTEAKSPRGQGRDQLYTGATRGTHLPASDLHINKASLPYWGGREWPQCLKLGGGCGHVCSRRVLLAVPPATVICHTPAASSILTYVLPESLGEDLLCLTVVIFVFNIHRITVNHHPQKKNPCLEMCTFFFE